MYEEHSQVQLVHLSQSNHPTFFILEREINESKKPDVKNYGSRLSLITLETHPLDNFINTCRVIDLGLKQKILLKLPPSLL